MFFPARHIVRIVKQALHHGWILGLAICYLLVGLGFERSWCQFTEVEPEAACCCQGVCACGDSCPGKHDGKGVAKTPTGPTLVACGFDGQQSTPSTRPGLPPHLLVRVAAFALTTTPVAAQPYRVVLRDRAIQPPDKIPISS